MQSLNRPIGVALARWFLPTLLAVGCLCLLCAPAPVSAQWNAAAATAPSEMANNAGGFSIGPPAGMVGRAAGAANAASAAAGGAMPPGNPTPPGGAPMPGGVAPANLPPLPSMTVSTVDAMVGQRVIDELSYRRKPNDPLILDDVRRIKIKESEKSRYSDDGKTQGDAQASDGLYSDIKPVSNNEYIGEATFFDLQRIDQLLQAAQAMGPLDFFGLSILTTERFSLISNMRDRIRQRNNKIMHIDADGTFTGWAKTFLRDYRVQPDNPNSPFFPLYVPSPPNPPALPVPPTPWKPMAGRDPAFEAAMANYLASLGVGVDRATEEARTRQRLATDPAQKRAFITQFTPATPGVAGAGGSGGMQAGGGQSQRRGGGMSAGGSTSGSGGGMARGGSR